MNEPLLADPVALEPPGLETGGLTPSGAPAATSPVLALHDIAKRWGNRTVLYGIDLVVEPGSRVWIGGQNGAGKTTLLRIVAGLIAPDLGTVRLDGLDPESNRRDYQRRIGFLQAGDRGLYARISVRQNLDFCARLAFVPRSERKVTVDRALATFGLNDLASRRSDRLSMGQRQRVRLAQAFLHTPHIVLLDEPRNSLDDEGNALLDTALSGVDDRGGTVIWCSPTLGHEEFDFNHTFVIDDGGLERA